jgi:hypothetical protein
MNRFLFAFLLCGSMALPLAAQNNCISWKCYNPPPYTCPYCDLSMYNGASDCKSYETDYFYACVLWGSCDTGMGNQCGPGTGVPCGPDQQWANFVNPKPLNEEWSLVRVRLTPKPRKSGKA